MQTVNLNGTDAADLAVQWRDVRLAAHALKKALQAAYPHGRDFIPQGGGSCYAMQELHRDMMQRAGSVFDYAFNNELNIANQSKG